MRLYDDRRRFYANRWRAGVGVGMRETHEPRTMLKFSKWMMGAYV